MLPIFLDVAVVPMIGAIVGLWVAIIAVLVIVIALIIKWHKKRKAKKE